MDFDLLNRIGVIETDPQKIIDELEAKKLDFEERMENMEDEGRIKQLQDKISQIDELISQANKELERIRLEEEKKAQEEAKKTEESEKPAAPKKEEADLIAVSDEEITKEDEIPVALTNKQKNEEAKKDIAGEAKKEKSENKAKANKTGVFGKGKSDKEKADKEHDKALEKKAQEIQKAAQKAKKEAEQATIAASANQNGKATNTTNQTGNAPSDGTGQNAGNTPDASGQAGSGQTNTSTNDYQQYFTDGMKAFTEKKYKIAEENFSKIGNANKKVKLNKDEAGKACYFLGMIYKKGFVGTADQNRALFWFKKAADEYANVEASKEYALHYINLPPQNNQEDNENVDTALKYFAIAADNGNVPARTDYINICLQRNITASEKSKAIEYIQKNIKIENDSYVKDTLKKDKKELSKKITRSATGKSGVYVNPGKGGIVRVIAYLGAFVAIYASLNLCSGFFYGSASKILVLDFLPQFNSIKSIDILKDIINEFQIRANINMISSSLVLLIGAHLVMGLDYQNETFAYRLIKGLSTLILALTCIFTATYLYYISKDGQMVQGFMVCTILVFFVLGISRKIGTAISDNLL